MKVLSFDIASSSGWAFVSSDLGVEAKGSFKHKNYHETRLEFDKLINKWRPDIIITAKPTRYYFAMRKMFLLTGCMLSVADKYGVEVYQETKGKKRKSTDFPNDSTMKKEVFGKGVVSKEEICARYGTKDEDAADACLFGEYLIKVKGAK